MQTKILTEAPALSCSKAGLSIPLLEATCKAGIPTDIFVSDELGRSVGSEVNLNNPQKGQRPPKETDFPYISLG